MVERSASVSVCEIRIVKFYQGLIEPPKAARGHVTYIDSKILHVTKFLTSYDILFDGLPARSF